MKNEKILSIVTNFVEMCIFHIDENGDIKEVVVNSKGSFNPDKKNIYEYFTKEEGERVSKLIASGLDEERKHLTLKHSCDECKYTDIEVKQVRGELYITFKFRESSRERELKYEKMIDHLSVKASTDPMTTLLNRYGYWERVKALLNCGDSERELGILLVDVDNLKSINDSKGHKGGDKALKQVSKLITDSIRSRDIAVRYGGDEFLIVVEELTGKKSTGYSLGKRLISIVNSKDSKMLTTVSIGVHLVKVGDFEKYLGNEDKLRIEWDKAVDIADKMAYVAKDNGRNQVVFSGNIKSDPQ